MAKIGGGGQHFESCLGVAKIDGVVHTGLTYIVLLMNTETCVSDM